MERREAFFRGPLRDEAGRAAARSGGSGGRRVATSAIALSLRMPVGSPSGPRSITPPGGSAVVAGDAGLTQGQAVGDREVPADVR